jgi:hypothetical protein
MKNPITISADVNDILTGGVALFGLRKKRVADDDPAHRHPMLYRDKNWPDLPASEKEYYCDMAAAVLNSFGVSTPVMPSFQSLGEPVS